MKWSSMGLFPTPLIKIEVSDYEKLAQFFDETIAPDFKSEHLLSHFHSDNNVFKLYPELDEFQKKLEASATFVYQDLLNHRKEGSLSITNAWFNLCEVGGSQVSHSHSNCLLSGTLYLHTDENSNIEFYHPLSTQSLHPELYDEPDSRHNDKGLSFHKRTTIVHVSNGDCLFWPSQLKHGYQNNQTPKRLTLSFNMMPTSLNSVYQIE